MKFSEAWLREWVNPAIETDTLCEQLTMAGLEVDSVTPVASEFNEVVVGVVTQCEKHSEADRLQVCEVDVGEKSLLNIVCGGKNVRTSLKVAVAKIGAKLPGGIKIKKTKLRGVVSEGMLCSEVELGMADTSEGIMVLPTDAPIGTNLREYLQLDDQSIDIELTPNRGDCISVAGIAREVGVLNRESVSSFDTKPIEASINEQKAVHLAEPEACPQYIGRVIKGINAKATTPIWMQEKLRRSGLRPIHPVVDITNYVMLEIGQPMHAFDCDKLNGDINVRRPNKAEKLKLLDGTEVEIFPETLVIADDKEAIALAGIMGGESSAVDENSENIFLESAFFTPSTIAGQARRYGLSTDSSHRFERGVDPALQLPAIHRASELLIEIVGGQAGPIIEAQSSEHLPTPALVKLRPARVEKILGIHIPETDMLDILQRLGMTVYTQGDEWEAQVPTFRFDIEQEIDLIEEIGRIHGYHLLPYAQSEGTLQSHPLAESQMSRYRMADSLIDRGYYETLSYSFVDPTWQAVLFNEQVALDLKNPISPELSQMRLGLWPSLLQTIQRNQHRQQLNCRVFEIGMRFVPQKDELNQEMMIAGAITGKLDTTAWDKAERTVDYFDIKGDVEAMLAPTGAEYQFIAHEHPSLHPGQSARIERAGVTVGWLGALHPSFYEKLDLIGPIYLFELSLAAIAVAEIPQFKPFSSYPAVRRDLALLVKEEISADMILGSIREQADKRLQQVELFDVYHGPGIPEGYKSMAIGLRLQHENRTLTEEEISEFVATLLDTLTKAHHVKLRE